MKLGHCHTCDHWLVERLTIYEDGETVVNFRVSKDGWGKCEKFDRETEAEFGCGFCEASGWDHRTVKHKAGLAWQHWEVKACPDCKVPGNDEIGRGYGCVRCAGTGKVRYYDDGFVGEEQTRLHPKQKEALALGAPKCHGCGRDLDVNWVACPYCGIKTSEPPGEREVIGFREGASEGTTNEMIEAARAKREAQVAVASEQVFAPPPPEQPPPEQP